MFCVLHAQSLAFKQRHHTLRRLASLHRILYSNSNTPPPRSITNATYWPEDSVENLEGYTPGGYHPTYIHDEFSNGRYKKENQYVAIKIVIADSTERSWESKILQHLQAGHASHPGRKYISSFLMDFSFNGPNGHHMCLVSEVASCSPHFMFPLHIAKAIAAQVIMGLNYLHSRGIVHGDLHSRNILLQPVDFNTLNSSDIYNRFSEPFKVPISRVDKNYPNQPHAPTHAIIPMNMIVPGDQLIKCNIKITDFGSSFFFGKEPPELHTPTILLPPEAIFQDPISPAADKWTLGCTIYDILSERPLFEPWSDDPDDVIGEMVSTLGKLPERWWQSWGKRSSDFHIPLKTAGTWSPGFRTLDQRLW
ncbi:hypothetical protein ASPBRDRAFT_57118 [Aspergillus brasiliensis CBS 101740]|uniref:non-specific serine/threonine protein kinase n=1 Tax=Aspergillus brasiliensis (strain CBS 101740 / IMI 381727 / IBT 21946) TaxID=767769 RepID=A0A1L9UCP7_ASPBC|nr:hypothetical protein ASPBRDRAFT_57118 [Aspergillus brasiliensis CBS 101740]